MYILHIFSFLFSLSHKIQSGVWRSFFLSSHSSHNSSSVSIAQALDEWLKVRHTGQVVGYMDECSGPRCNPLCPEEITLGQVGPVWRLELQICVSLIVIGIAIVCGVVRLCFYLWYKIMCKRQEVVIKENAVDPNQGPLEESNVCIVVNMNWSSLHVRFSVAML